MSAEGNINTPDYWDQIYRREWNHGIVASPDYIRDYGPIHDAVISLIADGSSVLDVACGPGLLCRKIKERRPATEVLGVDFSRVTVTHCQERDRSLGVHYRHLDIRHALPTLGRQFDVVCMCEILEHLEQPESVVTDAMGRLKPGGRFILTCPHDDDIPDPEHVRQWGHDEVFHLLAPYSDTISFRHFPSPDYHSWMLVHLIKQ